MAEAAVIPLLTSLGVGAETAGFLAPALVGGGLGAAGSAITGGKPLKGALTGALTGGLSSAASPFVGEALGIGDGLASALTGAATGAAGSALTGGSVGKGALTGGAIGGLENILSGSPSAGGGTGGAGGSAKSTAAPSGAAGGADVTQSLGATDSLKAFASNPNLDTFSGFTKANSWAGPAIGLGINTAMGQKPLPGQKQIEQTAGTLSEQGKKLQGYLDSGTLPPGAQQGLHQASEAAKATIKSQYASRGMSGSSAEAQDLAAVDQRVQAQGFDMALSLLKTGVDESNIASALYQNILTTQLEQDKELSEAFTNFGSALGGGTGSSNKALTLKLG